jgi:formamidopyrimidine-DNA glycosylase
MPELPEVEHNRRCLQKWTHGARIVEVVTDDARIVRPSKPRAFVRALTGQRVKGVERRGKWLRLSLDDGELLFAHLGMTGWFEHGSPDDAPLRFDRVHFDVERRGKRARVTYTDARRWGRMVLSRDDIEAWQALGPDPLDEGIDLAALAAKLSRRKKLSIKEALMDQRVLAGVGNIHAIEALWKARIDPRSTASALSPSHLRAIATGLRWTIDRALLDLARPDGGEKNPFKIYGHRNEPCPRCGTILTRLILGGRTTTLCPGCQSLLRTK